MLPCPMSQTREGSVPFLWAVASVGRGQTPLAFLSLANAAPRALAVSVPSAVSVPGVPLEVADHHLIEGLFAEADGLGGVGVGGVRCAVVEEGGGEEGGSRGD